MASIGIFVVFVLCSPLSELKQMFKISILESVYPSITIKPSITINGTVTKKIV